MAGKAQGIKAGRAYVEVGVSDKLTAGLRNAQRRLEAFGSGVRAVGRSIALTSAAGLAPAVLATRTFATFEQSMARVRALTGATTKQFESLDSEAKRLGETTVFTASQAAEAMSVFAVAGFSVDEIFAALAPTLDLAAAGQIGIAEAADITSKAMRSMGIAATEVGRISDVLTKGFISANTDLTMLGEAMKYIGPIARSAGVSIEEIVAAIQILSNAGIQGEMAGTSLRGMLITLSSPSKEAAAELTRLGVAVTDAAGNVRPFADIVEDLQRALQTLPSGSKLASIGTIFPNRQAAAAAALIEQGADELRTFTGRLEKSGGTAERIARIQLNTLTGSFILLKSAAEGLAIAFGESLVGPLRLAVTGLKDAALAATKWVRANRGLVAAIAAAAVGALLFGGALIVVGGAVQFLAFIVGGLATLTSLVAASFGAVASVLGALITPIGLVITGVAALGLALVKYSGGGAAALKYLGRTWGALHGVANTVIDGMRDALSAGDLDLAARVLWAGLKVVWLGGVADLNSIWQVTKGAFVRTAYQMWHGAATAITVGLGVMEVAWIESTAFLSKTWTRFLSGFQSGWATASAFVANRLLEIQGLFDGGFDVDTAKKHVRKETTSAIAGIEAEANAVLAAREKVRKAARRKTRNDGENALDELDRQLRAAEGAAASATESGLGAATDELAKAKQELLNAVEAARAAKEKAGGEGSGPAGDGKQSVFDELLNALGGRTAEVRGTFNPAAIRSLETGTSSTAERTAKAAENTARNTQRLLEMANRGAMIFS